jgi:hypothetical protein
MAHTPAAWLAIAAAMVFHTEGFTYSSGSLHLAGLGRSPPSPSSLSSSSKNLGVFVARTLCSRIAAKRIAGSEGRAASTGHRMAIEGEIVVHDAMPTIDVRACVLA